MRVLLIKDDSVSAQSIEFMLESERINLYTVHPSREGIDLARIYGYDIILLDLNLHDTFGLEVLRSIRVVKGKTPILIFLCLPDIENKIKSFGFEPGDYIIKPFQKDDLVTRMHAMVRRSKGHTPAIINIGDLTINLNRKSVEVAGARVYLTGKEYELLKLLSIRRGTTLTKEMFLNHVYSGLDEPHAKIIDVFICKLRKKLANASNGKNYIETIWGRGYALRDPSDDEAQTSALQDTRISSVGYR